MNSRLGLATYLLLIPAFQRQTAVECKKCDCTTYPQTTEVCVRCCFVTKGRIESTEGDTLTTTPLSQSPQRPTRKFKVTPTTKYNAPPKVGSDATIYYHKSGNENVATRIELTDYIEGQLTPGSEPTPAINAECMSFGQASDATAVLFGSNTTVALGFPYNALTVRDTPLVSLQRTEKGLLVSAKIFDAKQALIAQIVDNHFYVTLSEALKLAQPTVHSLTLFNGQSQILDIEFLNPHAIAVTGDFYGPDGSHIQITPEVMTINTSHLADSCLAGQNGIQVGDPSNPK